MFNKTKIAPSILSYDFAKLGEACKKTEVWGADFVHCDVMDGVFVPNLTFGMPMVKALRKHASIPFDVHLMILEPERYVSEFCENGADIVTFHPNASKDIAGALKIIKDKGKKCGLALNPDKPLSLVEPFLDTVDMIVIMGVYAGFGGQKFIEETLDKVKAAKKMIDECGREILLEVDGGVTEENAPRIIEAGANVLVAGKAVFSSTDPKSAISNLRN